MGTTTTTKNFLISIMGHENYKLEAYEKEMFLSISFIHVWCRTAKNIKFGFNSALQKIEMNFFS